MQKTPIQQLGYIADPEAARIHYDYSNLIVDVTTHTCVCKQCKNILKIYYAEYTNTFVMNSL